MPLTVLAAGSNLYAQLDARNLPNHEDDAAEDALTVKTPRPVGWQSTNIDEIAGISACQIVYRSGSSYKLAGFPLSKDAAVQESILQRMARSPPVKMLGKDFLQAWLDKEGRIHHIAEEKASSPPFVDADMDSHGHVLAVAAGDCTPRLYETLQDALKNESFAVVEGFTDLISASLRIIAGAAHFLIHVQGSEVYSLGDNRHFQQGHPHPSSWKTCYKVSFFDDFHTGIKSIAAGNLHTLFLTEDGAVYAAGTDADGQCGGFAQQQEPNLMEVGESEDAIQIACGSSHSVILTESQQIYICGSNHAGQLGLGHTENSSTLTPVPALSGKAVVSIQAAAWNTVVLGKT